MAVLQGLHPRAELQLGNTSSQGRWDMSHYSWHTHKNETTKKHNPDPTETDGS